jgi:hypothetical protein
MLSAITLVSWYAREKHDQGHVATGGPEPTVPENGARGNEIGIVGHSQAKRRGFAEANPRRTIRARRRY